MSHLECIDIPESVLDMAIHHQFAQTKNLTTQVERVPKARLLTLLENKHI